MALRRAKIQPTVEEKRYITLQHLEAGYMSGNRVIIHPVDTYNLTDLSGEKFTYKSPVETYIIYDERPKVGLLKKFGWYREDADELPQIAFIPTHLLYERFAWDNGESIDTTEPTSPEDGDQWFDEAESKLYTFTSGSWDSGHIVETEEQENIDSVGIQWFDETVDKLYTTVSGQVVNELLLEGQEFQELVKTGKSTNYILKPLEIKRGTLVDVFFDFAPDSQAGEDMLNAGEFSDSQDYQVAGGDFTSDPALDADVANFIDGEAEQTPDPYDFAIDKSIILNRFYVTDPKIDTVSINYVAKLMAYKYDAAKESEADQNPSNGLYLNFNSDEHGV